MDPDAASEVAREYVSHERDRQVRPHTISDIGVSSHGFPARKLQLQTVSHQGGLRVMSAEGEMPEMILK